ncbi:molybdopterin-dependent oxidoreductase [Rhizobium sp. L1K21]|uniref:molybdopterin-dependent oxidoreductase n=1 Tax=Rhizobium sp. L1K21 TaxID=2954933 RepID=UPI0020928E85|nr:molybdopterin-dependent oxidoreductase [Rhizobium sp. L1K21]MCO6188404.1 molybdopterin-dependent oxidoreductase [Rhizobium sp. L1K21]
MDLKKARLKATLFAIPHLFRLKAKGSRTFRDYLASRNCVVQIRLADMSILRYYKFENGKITSEARHHEAPDLIMQFKDIDTAVTMMTPPIDYGETIHAGKNFRVILMGDEDTAAWFTQLASKLDSDGWKYGEEMPDGSIRYTQMTNGGPLHVYVKDGRILRTNIIEFDDKDPGTWTIEARGKTFSPQRKGCVAPHSLAMKGNVYAENRLLYPMKRVDFDPEGERNLQNRGKSGYERISWDEALEIVSKEIMRQKQAHGPGAIALAHPSHHQWGNVGYYLSSMMRFGNLIGVTRVVLNPDSWEGWYWGAMHHYGNSMRLGATAGYGTLEDALQETDQIVYWSSDPESQFGAYGGTEASERRLWAKELGIDAIHINPHYSPTAAFTGGKWFPIRPGTDTALAFALMYVWITEDTYDHHFVENRSTGFDEWKDYILGVTDGIAKTPEWQEGETGIAARDARALARQWAAKKTYLSCGVNGGGFGGACRNASGIQWARAMVMLMAMQGWGRPGVNFGNLTTGAPVNLEFYFPGYGEGGISGELNATGSASNNYVRMPHILSVNPVTQMIPRQRLPEAILEGKAEGYLLDPMSQEAQMRPFSYPAPGYSKVHMLYRYGGSSMGTINGSSRFTEMYRSPELECVVSQGIWDEGETQFADIILPACTQFERWDIGEWSNTGGFGFQWYSQLNHRIIAIQHKCIEPLGESKSDYQIFWDICKKLGMGNLFSEGCSELDWAKRVFESSDISKHIKWKELLKRGYYVLPPEKEAHKADVDMRWFYEGRPKNLPEPFPLPGAYSGRFLSGLQTQSGKFEFIPSSLKRLEPESPDRPALLQYKAAFEGARSGERYEKYPIQLLTPHQRFSFHTAQDGKGGTLNSVADHRIKVGDKYFWIIRLSEADAAARGIAHHDLVKVFNDRGAVICAAEVTNRIADGVAHSYESAARYEPVGDGNEQVDIGGCMNILTPARMQANGTVASAGSLCLVEIERVLDITAIMEAAE